jgi:beta-RFAP synthase
VIIEGIVTTLDAARQVHIAPMGPRLSADGRRLTLRPFRTASTYENLKRHGEGVFHVTDDAALIARAAVGRVSPAEVNGGLRAAARVKGFILEGACRAFEFRVVEIDDREERATFEAEVVRTEELRPFAGFNRARHAVLEAAILATRVHLLPRDEVLARFASLGVLVKKTGGAAEHEALALLKAHVESAGAPGARELPESEGSAAGAARVRVRTGSRLHLGLLAPGGGGARRFGGAGIMVEEPGISLVVEEARTAAASGPLADRALEFARRYSGEEEPPYRLEVEDAPGRHTGLGSGTQLALAVGCAIATIRGEEPSLRTMEAIARQLGRGARSAIGIHGFARGGFLADGGRRGDARVAPLIVRHPVPEEWRFVIAIPERGRGLSGDAEREAFARLEGTPPAATDALCRLLLLGILPALLERDFAAFSEAVWDYGTRAGECFAAVQGGRFLSGEVEALVRFFRASGIAGVAQSSWGPAVFAVVEDEERGRDLARRLEGARPAGPSRVHVTRALERGAALERTPATPSLHTL